MPECGRIFFGIRISEGFLRQLLMAQQQPGWEAEARGCCLLESIFLWLIFQSQEFRTFNLFEIKVLNKSLLAFFGSEEVTDTLLHIPPGAFFHCKWETSSSNCCKHYNKWDNCSQSALWKQLTYYQVKALRRKFKFLLVYIFKVYSKCITQMCQGGRGVELPKLSQYGNLRTEPINLMLSFFLKSRFLHLQKTRG